MSERATDYSSISISDFLEMHEALEVFKKETREVVDFIIAHLSTVVDMAFENRVDTSTINAYRILCTMNREVTPRVLSDSHFHDLAYRVLSTVPKMSVSLSRLGALTVLYLRSKDEWRLKACDFVLLMLDHCEYQTIFDMFKNILCKDNNWEELQDWILMLGLRDAIVKEILELSKDLNNLSHMYRLIACAALNPRISAQFGTSLVFDVLRRSSDQDVFYVVDSKWEAISALCSEASLGDMECFIDMAKGVLKESITQIRQYHTYALKFLSKYLSLDPGSIRHVLLDDIPTVVLGLMFRFPSCSDLLDSVCGFVHAAIQYRLIDADITRIYLPPLIEECSKRKHDSITAFGYIIIEDIIDRSKKSQFVKAALGHIAGFDDFMKNVYKPRKKTLSSDYGKPRLFGIGK